LTAFTLAANATLRDVGNAGIWGVATARTGGDTVDTNGFKLTIDQDSRYGLSGTTSTTWGNLTINAAKGGEIHIDGTKVWMIPFTGGSGTLTLGTQITIGGITCNTIGIYTALNVAPATTGASGWLKVTNASGTPGTISSGTYAGFTLTANGAAIRGFIEVVGDANTAPATCNCNRLGTFRVTGEWFEIGTTSGTSNQTMQIPSNGVARYVAGVYIEATSGAGDYEFWPNAGTTTTTGTEAARGKVVWIDATGLCRIGNSGAATNGHTPTSGRKVVVPNIFFENADSAARTANVIPHATVTNRYDFTTTGAGVLEIDKCNMAWYLSVSQAYSCNISNSCFVDAILLDEIATPMTFTKVGVGNKPTTALSTNPLTITECFAGGTFTDCVWARVTLAASGNNINVLTDVSGFTFVRNIARANTIRGNATTYAWIITRASNCTWTDATNIEGAFNMSSCTGLTWTGTTTHVSAVSGTTVTTYTGYVWMATNFSSNILINSNLSLPVTNTQPYTSVLQVTSGSYNIKLRNIGTRAAPVSLGSTNNTGNVVELTASCSDVKVQRVYVSNTRTSFSSCDNSVYRVLIESCAGDYADADGWVGNNMTIRALGNTGSATAFAAVYGTHMGDVFTSTTAGRIYIRLNEANAATASYITLTGGAAFTGAGALYMPTIGMSCTFEMQYYALGHTAFANSALIMAGGTATNYTYEYAIDKNDGNGYSTMTSSAYTATTLGTALSGITGIDASKGFKLKLKMTTGTTNTTAITSAYITTVSTTTAQDYQYPLDTNTVTFTGLPTGCDAVTLTAGTSTILDSKDSMAGTSYSFTYSGAQNVDVGFLKPGYVPFYIRNLALTTTDASIPVSLTVDRNYA
jgi:hypothetical protein